MPMQTKRSTNPDVNCHAILKVPDWFRGPATDNVVYADLNNQATTSLKMCLKILFNKRQC